MRAEDYFAGDSRSNYERMRAGDEYVSEDPRIEQAQAEAVRRTAAFNHAYDADPEGSQRLARELFGAMGEGAHVRGPVRVDYGTHIIIGDQVFINWGLIAVDVGQIRIGADSQLGPGVQLLTATHPIAPEPRRAKVEGSEPITLEENVWLGGGVIVCPGVTIGRNTVVGAGAVVTRDLPADAVVVGNPARVIRERI